MKVLVCGARDWDDWPTMEARLTALPDGTHIIEGGAFGADLMARRFALLHGWPFTEVPARWNKHGKSAGPVRNRQMLDMKPDLVIAFHPDLSKSKGTADTVDEARRRGVPVDVVPGTRLDGGRAAE